MSEFPEQIYRHATYTTTKAWRERKTRYRLEGSKCNDCGLIWFPHRSVCTSCNSRDTTPHELSGEGSIYNHYVRILPQAWVMGYQELEPRIIVVIQMDDGPFVLSEIVESAPDEVKDGDRVRMVTRKLRRESNSNWQYGFKFVKVESF